MAAITTRGMYDEFLDLYELWWYNRNNLDNEERFFKKYDINTPYIVDTDSNVEMSLLQYMAYLPYGCSDKKLECLMEICTANENYININARNNQGNTALHYATMNSDCVEELIGKGADVNARNNEADTPLHIALRIPRQWTDTDNTAIAILLIKNGADINARNNEGYTPLHIICGMENTENKNSAQIMSSIKKIYDDSSSHCEKRKSISSSSSSSSSSGNKKPKRGGKRTNKKVRRKKRTTRRK